MEGEAEHWALARWEMQRVILAILPMLVLVAKQGQGMASDLMPA